MTFILQLWKHPMERQNQQDKIDRHYKQENVCGDMFSEMAGFMCFKHSQMQQNCRSG